MSSGGMISKILETLPVGYRFDPTDEELIGYLKLKISGMNSEAGFIPEVDLCKWEPWQLPDLSVIKTYDPEWFFFSLLDLKYSKGSRSNRATKGGYWKPTGQDREIKSGKKKREVIGTKKTLVFYSGRAPTASKTGWVIHEYRADIAGIPAHRAYVLCRLKRKTDDNTKSNIPSLGEAVADYGVHQNNLTNNTTFGAGPSYHSNNIGSDFGNSPAEEITSYEGPQLSDFSSDFTSNPQNPDWFPDVYQGLDWDLPSPSSFNFNYGGMEFQGGDEFFNFEDSYPRF